MTYRCGYTICVHVSCTVFILYMQILLPSVFVFTFSQGQSYLDIIPNSGISCEQTISLSPHL